METYRGLILAQRSAGDKGKFIDLLTEKNTVEEVYVRGAKKLSSSGVSATQLFSYVTCSVQMRHGKLYLDSAEPIRIFYRLRENLMRLSLASYYSELIRYSVHEFRQPDDSCDILRLTLNTLHHLENGTRDVALLKPLFETRLMTELGMMPDVMMCRKCGAFLPEKLYFSVENGFFCCASCGISEAHQRYAPVLLSASALQALRHMIFADFDRLYQFRLGTENLTALQRFSERFVLYHLNFTPKSLAFYQEISKTVSPQDTSKKDTL